MKDEPKEKEESLPEFKLKKWIYNYSIKRW